MDWFKVKTDILVNKKTVGLTNAELGLYIRLLAICAQNGGTSTLLPQHFNQTSARLQQKINLTSAGLLRDIGGGFFEVVNWDQHQSLSKSAGAERVARYRERKKSEKQPLHVTPKNVTCNALDKTREDKTISNPIVPVTRNAQNHDDQQADQPIDGFLIPIPEPPAKQRNAYPEDFEKFWEIYPRKHGKGAAAKAWLKAKQRATPQEILDGAARLAADPNREDRFTPHGSTWLNESRWGDAPLPSRGSTGQASRIAQGRAAVERWAAIENPAYDAPKTMHLTQYPNSA